MVNLTQLTISKARELLSKKDISSTELTKSFIEKIEKSQILNAYIEKTFDLALKQALKADEALGSSEQKPLCGIPLGVKDIFCCKNIKT